MQYILVSIRDRSIESYQQVFTVRAPGEAVRSFIDAINNEQSGVMHKHPDDFDLYKVGTFDDQTGKIEPCAPEKLADGKNIALTGE